MLQPVAAPQPADTDLFLKRLQAIASAENLAPKMRDEDLARLGSEVIEGHDIDLESMSPWIERMKRALDLAMLEKEEKTYPWDKAANISFPLVTSAALQYNARAYPAIVPSTEIVKTAVHGEDKDSGKATRGQRIAKFLTWQLTVDSREWERGTDQMTLQLPIVGDLFRKVWWDVASGKLRSQIRLPGKHIVVNNNATALGVAPRLTDTLMLYPHQIETYFRTGRFKEITIPQNGEDKHKPECFLEQMCRHDLDNDGYAEPYIVTVHKETEKVVRVVAAYDMDTIRTDGQRIIAAEVSTYLIHYQFMPSMDGGLLGTGMGLLLGDISETINSTLNMIMDSGHLASLGGGFIAAQNFRVKGGVQRLKPGEYRHVNFTGDDVRKGIVDLQFPGPNPVMFQVLGLMIDAGREITSVSNVMTGEAGQRNMPVGTVMALIEQGQMVFTASYKRIYRALQDEFELICKLNRKYLSPQRYQAMLDQPASPQEDFNLSDMDVTPVADPRAVTSMQRMSRAQFLMDLAEKGMVDPQEAIRRVLEAAAIEDVDALMPKPNPKAKVMEDFAAEMMVLDLKIKEAELDDLTAATMQKIAAAQVDATEADLAPLKARVAEFKAMKEALSEKRAVIAGSAGGMALASGDGVRPGGPAPGGTVQ